MPDLTFEESAHLYRFNGHIVPSVTTILQDCGIIDYSHLPDSVREIALLRGRAVHAATHFDDENDLAIDRVHPMVLPYLAAWRLFREQTGFIPDLIEHRGFHQTYRYAGTLDRKGRIGNAAVMLDIKTNAAPWWTCIQVAAYAAFFENPRTYRRVAVELHVDGTYRLYEFPCGEWHADFQVFLAALSVYNAKRRRAQAKETAAA
jgi:hypothetical protein